jgi:hypothetical protein
MYGNQFVPFNNGFYGQQPINRPQPVEMSIPQQNIPTMQLNRQNGLLGKSVDNIEVVKAIDIPLDGSISYFPIADGSAIVTKQLQQDGTSRIIVYKPMQNKETPKYVTFDDLNKKLEDIDFSDIDDLKVDLDNIKKEMKDIRSRLKSKTKE